MVSVYTLPSIPAASDERQMLDLRQLVFRERIICECDDIPFALANAFIRALAAP